MVVDWLVVSGICILIVKVFVNVLVIVVVICLDWLVCVVGILIIGWFLVFKV